VSPTPALDQITRLRSSYAPVASGCASHAAPNHDHIKLLGVLLEVLWEEGPDGWRLGVCTNVLHQGWGYLHTWPGTILMHSSACQQGAGQAPNQGRASLEGRKNIHLICAWAKAGEGAHSVSIASAVGLRCKLCLRAQGTGHSLHKSSSILPEEGCIPASCWPRGTRVQHWQSRPWSLWHCNSLTRLSFFQQCCCQCKSWA